MKYIDLFAGCGGLSLGISAAGFELAFAIEKSAMASESYYHNLIEKIESPEEWESYLEIDYEDRHQFISAVDIRLLTTDTSTLLRHWEQDANFRRALSKKYSIRKTSSQIDLICGGPPCQGFSMAGKRNIDDKRNNLPSEFLNFVEIFNPKFVLMENVVGMRKKFALNPSNGTSAVFQNVAKALSGTGYHGYAVQELQLNAAHYAVPQNRPRVFLLGMRNDLAKKASVMPSGKLWFSGERGNSGFCPPVIDSRHTVADAFAGLGDFGATRSSRKYQNELAKLTAPITLKEEKTYNHKARSHSDTVRKRFSLYQYFQEKGIKPAVFFWADRIQSKDEDLGLLDRLDSELRKANAKHALTSGVKWRTRNELKNWVYKLATRKHSQRALERHFPSPTVLSIPDDVVHPIAHRTLTVREQARLQSFPDAFEFRSKETTGGQRRKIDVPQYTQVGNAVPPLLALAIGKHIREMLSSSS